LLPFEAFHFAKFDMSNGLVLYITSLSDSDLYNSLTELDALKNVVKFSQNGPLNRGALINSIWWSKL